MRALPVGIVRLEALVSLEAANNQLVVLPKYMHFMASLERLVVPGNQLLKLPDTLSAHHSLRYLDVALNKLRYLPKDFQRQLLRPAHDPKNPYNEFHFHCEKNPFIRPTLVASQYIPEPMSLKEIATRVALDVLNTRRPAEICPIKQFIKVDKKYELLIDEINEAGEYCRICDKRFVGCWLECIQFCGGFGKGAKKDLPVNVRLCSYACFKKPGHDFLGLASE